MRRALLAVVLLAALTACGGGSESAPTPTPTPSPTASTAPAGLKPACDYLSAADVSALLGDSVMAVPKGDELCSFGELDLSVLPATAEEFDEERGINSSDSDTPPPSLGLGDDSYLILGDPGGTASAGVLEGGTKAVLALPGDVPQDIQRTILTTFAAKVAAQL